MIDRYLLGTLGPEEADWAAAFFADPVRQRILQRFLERVEGDVDAIAPDTARSFEELQKQLFETALGKQTLRTARQKEGVFSGRTLPAGVTMPTLRRWIGTVGAIGLAVMLALIAYRGKPMHTAGRTHMYATNAHQQAVVTLEDGTRVMLAPRTTLRVTNFSVAARAVVLDSGEAYFTVANASAEPFVVYSGRVTTRVLGTEFLVQYHAKELRVRVAVASGKVHVTTPARWRIRSGAGITLSTGDVGDITDSTMLKSTIEQIAPDAEWVPGQLLFRHIPVAVILRAMSRWYGYQFRYADSTLAERKVSIGISTQSSAEALSEIEKVLAVNLNIVGDTITLIPSPIRSTKQAPQIRTYDVWTAAGEVGR